ncbi:hypothetical protein [Micromonospora sp. C41]|uniref:hypothetical protein n=1 Tax=Micromonospora sp. C41 TaxID=2824878 RepID=UPI001B37E3B1|nr:hypothetical protein [Micromonospora sp. C41]MBQ1064501.1 hypothetical protein [Micromonospora sp. C41]
MNSTTPHHTAEVHTLPYDQAAQRAVTALTSGQETFTRTQVAYLMGLALQVGIDAAEQADDPALWQLAYETGYADGISDGEEGALAEVWEGIRFAYSGPRRQPDPRRGVRGNLTAADATWWAQRAVDQRATERAARQPRPDDHPGGAVDWETGRPVRHLEVAA